MPSNLLMANAPTPEEVAASRRAAGLTQAQAAAVVGMTTAQAWSRYETAAGWGRPMDLMTWSLWLLATDQHPGYRAMPTRRRAQQNEALQSLADDSQTYGAKGF